MQRDTCRSLPSWAACLVAVSACAGPATAPGDPSVYSNPYIEALAEALGERRLFEPRLTGGFAWAPCQPPEENPEDLIPSARCGELPEPGTAERAELLEVWTEIVEAAEDHGERADLLHARGVGHLLWSARGDEVELERAVGELERAAELAPQESAQRAAVLSDLAAAYLVRAGELDQPGDLARGLEAAAEGLELADRAETRFARALALEELSLGSGAQQEWRRFLETESHPDWIFEARSHLSAADPAPDRRPWSKDRQRLEEAILDGDAESVRSLVAARRQEAREYAEARLLARWARAQADGESGEAERALRLAAGIGGALAALGGDRMLHETVRHLAEASRSAFPTAVLEDLVDGFQSYAEGLKLDRVYSGDAGQAFERAWRSLDQAGSPFAPWAKFQVAIARYRQSRLFEALDLLNEVARGLPETFPVLRGRVEWIRGMCHLAGGDPEGSQQAYERAVAWFQRAHEPARVAAVRVLQAESLAYVGQPEGAWPSLLRALQAPVTRARRTRHAQLDQGTELATATAGLRAALAFQDEMAGLEEREPNATDSAHAHYRRCRTLAGLGREDAARDALETARRFADAMPEGPDQDRMRADLAIARAELLGRSDARSAVDSLTESLAFYGNGDRTFELIRLLEARSGFWSQAGNPTAAERDLRRGLRVLEGQLAAVEDVGQVGTFLHQESALAYGLVDLLASSPGREGDAFTVADRYRGLDLLALRGDGARERESVELGWKEISEQLGGATALIEYTALDDRLLIWGASSSRRTFRTVPVSRDRLAEAVSGLRRALADRSVETADTGARTLYEHLVHPVARVLEGRRSLVIVPDGPLADLPFAVLKDPETGRLLIRNRSLTLTSSASRFLASRSRERGSRGGRGERLVIGAGRPPPPLPPLVSAEAEAREVADLLGVAAEVESLATRARFLSTIRSAATVHFTGHAVTNGIRPELSYLAFNAAGAGPEESFLSAAEIAAMDLHGLSLVVLSACNTAGSETSNPRGMPLARAFLAAGASSVVASLWPVEDGEARELMLRFYDGIGEGFEPAEALRAAQAELLGEGSGATGASGAGAAFTVFTG